MEINTYFDFNLPFRFKALIIRGFLFSILISSLCPGNIKKENGIPYLKHAKSTMADSIQKTTCESFLNQLFGANNLSKLKDMVPRNQVKKLSDSTYIIDSDFSIKGHNIKYSVFSKKDFGSPLFFDYRRDDFLFSLIKIDDLLIRIDTFIIEPRTIYNHMKMKKPLTFCNILKGGHFYNNDIEYIVLQGYPPCNGGYCNESYLFLISIKDADINLKVLIFNEYHPFTSENIFIGDIDKNGKLEYFFIYEVRSDYCYNIKKFTIENDSLLPIAFDKTRESIYYSCELCSGEINDTILVFNSCKYINGNIKN